MFELWLDCEGVNSIRTDTGGGTYMRAIREEVPEYGCAPLYVRGFAAIPVISMMSRY